MILLRIKMENNLSVRFLTEKNLGVILRKLSKKFCSIDLEN